MRSIVTILLSFAMAFSVLPPPAAAAGSPSGFDAGPWLADLDQLQHAMSAHYANLEWAIAARRTDLAELVRTARARLGAAHDEAEARKTIETFLASFGDGHIEIDWPSTGSDSAEPASLCRRLGYTDQGPKAGIRFSRLTEGGDVASPASAYFPTSMFRLRDGSRVGVLHIFAFSAKRYIGLCEEARAKLGLAPNAPCDDACSGHVQLDAENALTQRLTAAIRSLEALADLRALVVDLTGNGGGSDWLEPAARELTARPLASPQLGFVRSDVWTNELQSRIDAIAAALPMVGAGARPLFEQAKETYAKMLAAARERCDRSPVWADRPIACTQIVRGMLTTSGTLPYAAPGSLPDVDASQYLFGPSAYRYEEGVYNGPLVVLVDQNTASSAERFTAMLRDASAAKVVGVPTAGAGCGFTNGGIPTVLAHSGASVRLPDCIQYRSDGTNAVAGITPDVLIPWRPNDSDYQRAERAYAGVSEALEVR